MTRSRIYPHNLFVFSNYWGTWSRVLQFMQGGSILRAQIEVDLTPVNADGWKDIEEIHIRSHITARDDRDVYTADLPDHVLEAMRLRLQAPVIERLLHEDFLPQIDWVKHRAVSNGGASLFRCLK